MGAVFLISAGFMLGLIVGVVKEEPELVMGHLSGQSEEVPWSEQGTELGLPAVGAAGPGIVASDQLGAADYYDSNQAAGDDFGFEAASTAAEDQVYPAYEAPQPTAVMAPVQTPAAPQAAPREAVGAFSVQVGAFSESEPAEQIADDLRSKGFPVYVTPSAGSRDGRWRVRVGPMGTRAEADEVAQQLKSHEQLPTWVVTQ
jgi:cell division protein FtsN